MDFRKIDSTGSTSSYIPLPTCIQNREAVINIKNKDEQFFLLAFIAGYMEILIEDIMNVYLITWSMRRNSTFKLFHFQSL